MLYSWGAQNVNVISTITKKGRPGYIVLVDCGSMDESRLLEKLASRFGIFGHHMIKTIHSFQPVASGTRELTVRYNGRELQMTMHYKQINPAHGPIYIRVEWEDLMRLKDGIEDAFGLELSLPVLRRQIETLLTDEKAYVLNL